MTTVAKDDVVKAIVEEIGVKAIIDAVGIKAIVEEIGVKAIVEVVGLDVVIKEMGVNETLIALERLIKSNRLTQDERKQIRTTLEKLLDMLDHVN